MPLRRRHSRAAVLFAAAIAWAGMVGGYAPAWAQDSDSFTVHDVQVDVTAENVNVARQQAFAKGQRDAFDRLIQRFTTADEASHVPAVSSDELDNLVLDVGVDQEKRSNVRYIATLSVRFKSEAIRRLLHDAGIAYTEWRGRPMLVLPVLKTDVGPLLWEKGNAWRNAWIGGAAQGLVPLVVPTPPPAGQAPDDALQAAAAGPDVLAAFAARFEAQDLLAATGVVGRTDDGRATFDVVLAGAGPLASAVAGARNWQGEPGESLESVLRRAVVDIAASINEAYKRDNMLPAGDAESLSVMVPVGGLADWTQLRDRLTRTPAVRSWEVGAMSQTSASLILHFVGAQQQLEAALVQNGLVLSWADDHWVLQTAQAKPAEKNP
jgi:hypothetical protein